MEDEEVKGGKRVTFEEKGLRRMPTDGSLVMDNDYMMKV